MSQGDNVTLRVTFVKEGRWECTIVDRSPQYMNPKSDQTLIPCPEEVDEIRWNRFRPMYCQATSPLILSRTWTFHLSQDLTRISCGLRNPRRITIRRYLVI